MAENNRNIPLYTAGAMQVSCNAVNACPDKESAFKVRMGTLEKIRSYVTANVGFVDFYQGSKVRLVCLPEYILSGFMLGESHDEWHEKACIHYDGPEYEFLGKLAQDNNIFLSGNVYEIDPNFPELYFQTCFIIGPNGDVILRYRRLTSAFEMTPHDVLDKYLDIYGVEGLFPVADTEIGRLGCIASEEIMWPELVRAMCLRGTEVLLQPTSEPGSPKMTDRQVARKARAMENHIYIVASNTASIENTPIPAFTCSAQSCVVDYKGDTMAEAASGGESMLAHAIIDIDYLRARRRQGGMFNHFSRQLTDVYAMMYAKYPLHTGNALLKDGEVQPHPDRDWFRGRQDDLLERLTKAGLL
jgi:predicted amidohydrolase